MLNERHESSIALLSIIEFPAFPHRFSFYLLIENVHENWWMEMHFVTPKICFRSLTSKHKNTYKTHSQETTYDLFLSNTDALV